MTIPIATIRQGQLKGVTGTDLNGERYYKFLGIPYAKPPVGPLRFKAPQPAESWICIQDATKEGNPCLAPDPLTMKFLGSEDCLYLNVFTRELPRDGLSSKPVMVFIHGGGFTVGSGSEQMLGSKNLMAEDVVLVTINYRLGIFGFLSSDDLSLDTPGNAGLKDQTFALKWVQDNISSFNGDPKNVTIFGISAGGASVHFQVLTPTAKGLFHKAIAQSGSALNPWAWGQKNMIQVADKLGKTVSNDKEALQILMNVSANELSEASLKIPDVLLNASKRRPFGPVIEKPNPTSFLDEDPTDLLLSGKFNQVPVIQGLTSKEGLLVEFGTDAFSITGKPTETGVPWNFGVEENSQKHAELQAKINNFYFKDGETKEATYEVIGDVCFTVGIVESAKLAAKISKSSVYLYVFSYRTAESNGLLKMVGFNDDNVKGVLHGGDIPFLFNSEVGANVKIPSIDPKLLEEHIAGIRIVTKIWADFARTGRPHELWEPLTDENELKYFDINQDPKLKINPFPDRLTMWQDVLKDAPKMNAKFQERPII
jgi:carboxylesterase type B